MTLSKCCGGISAHSSVLCPFFGDFAGAFLIIVMLHNLTGHELLVGHSPSAFPGKEQNSWLDELSRSSHSKTAPDNHTTTRTIDCWFDVLDGWIDKKNRIFMSFKSDFLDVSHNCPLCESHPWEKSWTGYVIEQLCLPLPHITLSFSYSSHAYTCTHTLAWCSVNSRHGCRVSVSPCGTAFLLSLSHAAAAVGFKSPKAKLTRWQWQNDIQELSPSQSNTSPH